MQGDNYNSILSQFNPNLQNELAGNFTSSVNSGATPVNNNATYSNPSASSAPAPKGNWLTHLFPTGGAMAGGAGGAALGTMVLPGVGTVLGGILGAALGGGGAKVAENEAEGNAAGDGVASTALESGAGQAIGGVVGKGLGMGAKYLAGRSGNIIKVAADAAEQKAAQNAEVDTAKTIYNNFGGVKHDVQAANDLEGNQKLLQSWGVDHTSPEAMSNASKGGLFIDDIDQAALKGGQPIKTTDLISSKDITAATPEEQQALLSPKVGIIGEDGTMPQTVTPQQAHAFAQDLNNQIRDLQGVAQNAKANGNYTEYNAAKQHLSDLTSKYNNIQNLAGTPDVNASIAARTITPEEKSQLVEQFGQKQADHIETAVNEAQTHQDLVKAKLPFAQMNNLSSQALNDAKASATTRAVARVKGDTNGDGMADAPVPNTPSSADAVHATVSGGGNPITMLAKGIYHAKDNPAILDVLSRIGGMGAKLAPTTGGTIGASNAQIQNTNDTTGGGMPIQTDMSGQTGQPMPGGTPGSPTGGLSRDDLITLALYSPSAFQSIMTPSMGQQQNVSTANTAEQALSSLGQAPGGGIFSQLAGHLGIGATGEYQRKAANVAQQVAAALPGSDAGTVQRELTNYNGGSGNINEAVQQLLANLQAVKQNNTNGAYQQLMNYNPSVLSAAGL